MNGILHEIVVNDWVDRDYITRHVVGCDELEQSQDCPPERAASICDVPVEKIREATRILRTAQRLLSTVPKGFYQSKATGRGLAGEHFQDCLRTHCGLQPPRRAQERPLTTRHKPLVRRG